MTTIGPGATPGCGSSAGPGDSDTSGAGGAVSEDDRRLIAECVGGRREAFGDLVARYQPRLYRTVARLVGSAEDAADVVQDTFLAAYRSLPAFKGDAAFFTWLYRIAFNTAATPGRRRPAVAGFNADPGGEGGREPADPSECARPVAALERAEEEGWLYAALGRLAGWHREVLVMKDMLELIHEPGRGVPSSNR